MLPIVALENESVLLSPLIHGDWEKLSGLNHDASLWTFFPYDLSDDATFAEWMDSRVDLSKEGKWYPFLVTNKKTNTAVGLSCYLSIDEENFGLEIGGTWYTSSVHGTNINPNCKLLLLAFAFETLNYERVELKTDALNVRSRRAIEKMGAKYEGILRSNRIVQSERRRDTVYYSILKAEWPEVKQGLEERITKYL